MLREKGRSDGHVPHQLIMTATPIPRTLAMTAYADLDVSVIDELPPGRTPIRTVVMAETRRDEVVARIAAACSAGRQAYWVCPLIEESEELEFQAAEATYAALVGALPALRIGIAHGQLTSAKKEAVMAAFKRGDLDLLVATTVIEVGVDVPNASLMVIENAERMGLSQLHQLRGRVGRGAEQSYCLLISRTKDELTDNTKARLQALVDSTDGFELAERDLELRGEGQLLGTRQSGVGDLRFTRLRADRALLERARELARGLVAEDGPWHDEADRLLQGADPANLA